MIRFLISDQILNVKITIFQTRTFIFLRCFIFGTFLLAGRTILSALIHSSYLKKKIKIKYKDKRHFHQSDLWKELRNILTPPPPPSPPSPPPHRHLYCLTQTCCCDTISLNSKRKEIPWCYVEKDKPLRWRKKQYSHRPPHKSYSTEFRQYQGCYLGRMRRNEKFHDIAHDRHNAENIPLSFIEC